NTGVCFYDLALVFFFFWNPDTILFIGQGCRRGYYNTLLYNNTVLHHLLITLATACPNPGGCLYLNTHTHTQMHTNTQTDAHTNTHTQIHTHTHTQTHTHTHRDTHTQRHTHRDTHTETHTQRHTHRDTHTETHTQRHTDTHTGT